MRDKYLYNSKDKESDYTSDDELRGKEEKYFDKEKQRQEGKLIFVMFGASLQKMGVDWKAMCT